MELAGWFINPAQVTAIRERLGNHFNVMTSGGQELTLTFDTGAKADFARAQLMAAVGAAAKR